MANEAEIVELLGNGGDPIRYTCADGNTIEKGSLLWFLDPRLVSGASNLGLQTPAGVAAQEKVANDGKTSIPVYTNGLFDIVTATNSTITAGDPVTISGVNVIATAKSGDTDLGRVLGIALEGANSGERIVVRVRT